MSLTPSIISIIAVNHYEPCSFPQEKIEMGAALILACEGTVKPLLVKRCGVDGYTLIRGDFVYWCALRAHEMNPLQAENIDAYIAENAMQEAQLIAQYDLF